MPVFTIETPTGKQLDIEAADQATAMQGAQQWHGLQQYVAPPTIATDATQAPPATPATAGNAQSPPALRFDFDGARKAGYSDAEIATHLGEQHGFDVSSAMQAGYSPAEIITHLGGAPTESGVIDSARQGTANVLGGVGATLRDYLGQGLVGDALTRYAKA